MMQNKGPVKAVPTTAARENLNPSVGETTPERSATIWVSRITSFVGLVCLSLALIEWAFRPGHYRTVLALLVVAMFAAILHSYTFENGSV